MFQGGHEDLGAAMESAPDPLPLTTGPLNAQDINPAEVRPRATDSSGLLSLRDSCLSKPTACLQELGTLIRLGQNTQMPLLGSDVILRTSVLAPYLTL